LNLGLRTCTLPLQPHPQPFRLHFIFQIGSCVFAQADLDFTILLCMPPT
jgi:hypothetical protein